MSVNGGAGAAVIVDNLSQTFLVGNALLNAPQTFPCFGKSFPAALHEAEFIIYEAALRQLKVLAPGKKLPATSKLNTEIEALISEKNAAYNTYRTAKAEYEQLATAKRNAEQILHGTPSRQKKHEQER